MPFFFPPENKNPQEKKIPLWGNKLDHVKLQVKQQAYWQQSNSGEGSLASENKAREVVPLSQGREVL